MKHFQRCAALALALTVALGALAIPSHAAQQYVSTGSFWSAVGRGLTPIGRKLLFFWNDSVCSASKDARHSGYLHFTMAGRGGDTTYYAKCQYCGEHFKLTEKDIENQYNDYVSNLPGSGVNKSGGFFIPVPIRKVTNGEYNPEKDFVSYSFSDNVVRFNRSSSSISIYVYYDVLTAPVDGHYRLFFVKSNVTESSSSKLYMHNIAGTSWTNCSTYDSISDFVMPLSSRAVSAGNPLIRIDDENNKSDGNVIQNGTAGVIEVYMYCQPSTLPGEITDTDSRPTFGDGSIGIVGDNGQITQINGNQIFDESTNLVYNPVTNTTVEVSNWTYDYASRTYYLTLGNGSTQEIRYGDENITIVEGDTIYNVYYVVPTNPDNCDHTYTTTVTTAPTCTVGGLDTYTCSKCGYSYTQKTPAAGHTWTVKQSVQTEYDESGNIVTQGYTIYKCSVCAEEYKDSDGTGPPSKPSTGSGDDDDGIIDGTLKKLISGLFKLISGIIGGIVDGLLTLISTAVDKLTQVVNLFGTFGEALSVLWSWLPTDVVAVLVAGVTVVVFAAVLKIFVK